MEVDTGATVSLIPISIQKQYFQTAVVEASDTILTTYTGEQIPIVTRHQKIGLMCTKYTALHYSTYLTFC